MYRCRIFATLYFCKKVLRALCPITVKWLSVRFLIPSGTVMELSGVNISFTPNAGHELTGSPCISISMPLKLHCSCLDGKRPMSESAYSLNNSARDKNPTEDTENGTVSSIHSAIESAPAYIKWHGNFCVRVVIVGWIRSAPFDFVSLPA